MLTALVVQVLVMVFGLFIEGANFDGSACAEVGSTHTLARAIADSPWKVRNLFWLELLPLSVGFGAGAARARARRSEYEEDARVPALEGMVRGHSSASWGEVGARNIRVLVTAMVWYLVLGVLVGMNWAIEYVSAVARGSPIPSTRVGRSSAT